MCDIGMKCAVLLLAAVAAACSERGNTTGEFKDCAQCPEMTVLPAGAYMMGAAPSDSFMAAERQHNVTIRKPFAVSKYEITFDEWDACVANSGCNGYTPGDDGWGRGKRPVINVSWDVAKAYVAWLARKTGRPYRLLSETEWEYAARAGTATEFAFGSKLTSQQANFDASADGGANLGKTVPVGSFKPNAFGLYDMHGNVWEWVEDCWTDEYTDDSPKDETAVGGSCGGHVIRGGGWEDSLSELRSAARTGGAVDDRYYTDGVRVAVDL